MAAHASDWGAHHGDGVCVGGCVGARWDSLAVPTVGMMQAWVAHFVTPLKRR